MGRPPKLTKEVEKRLIQAISSGLSRRDSCDHAGIGLTAFQDWLSRGRAGDKRYVAFAMAVRLADGKAAKGAMDVVRRSIRKGSLDAAKWWLTHCRPKQYSTLTRSKTEVTGKNGGPLCVDYSKLSDAELE